MIFTAVETLLLAGLALVLGTLIHRLIPWTARYNLPGSVLGGFVFALLLLGYRQSGGTVTFATDLQTPLMIAFFASLGFSASISRLIAGGKPLMVFFIATVAILILQDIVGIGVAVGLGQSPLFGVMTSSVSLVGGPGTALAFAPAFEKAGMADAGTIGLTAALGGIICAGLFGGPLSTFLIERNNLRSTIQGHVSIRGEEIEHFASDRLTGLILSHIFLLVIAIVLGFYVSRGIQGMGITLPPYIGSMIVAAVLRNLDDKFEVVRMRESWLDALGSSALAIFIAMSMMTLDFAKLKDVGFPILIALLLQVGVVLVAARYLMFPLLGRTYEAAVLSGGMFGFMMGTVANAMANIETIQRRKGPAPNAGLFISLVGACFIDFVNAAVITVFLNIL